MATPMFIVTGFLDSGKNNHDQRYPDGTGMD